MKRTKLRAFHETVERLTGGYVWYQLALVPSCEPGAILARHGYLVLAVIGEDFVRVHSAPAKEESC